MALDQEYFDSINIEIAKKKYYNANKVESVLADIRTQALAMNEENQDLRAQLEELKKFKCDISETLLSAKTISQTMIEEATEEADRIVAEAEDKAKQILADAEEKAIQEVKDSHARDAVAAEHVRSSIERIRAMHIRTILELDEVLRDYEAETATEEPEEEAPADLGDKISAIASQVFSLNSDDEDDE